MKTSEQILLDALKNIRTLGYESKITRTKETVLECIRIAESAILDAESAAIISVQRPASITSWIWWHFSFADLPHWQHCLVAAVNANASDVIEAARKMYIHQGGEMRTTRTGRHKKRQPQTGDEAEAAGRRAYQEATRGK